MDYIAHLSKDRKLAKVLAGLPPFQLKKRNKIYLYLCSSIISQQLSVKVADVIFQRFLDLYGGIEPTAQQILDTDMEELRRIGLSQAKARYVREVASFEITQGMKLARLNKMSDEEIIDYLTPIKGVGRWTVEMLLMFALGREDVFAVDDLGIQKAMAGIYKLDDSDRKNLKQQMEKISRKWSPYRTYACLALWRWKDGQ